MLLESWVDIKVVPTYLEHWKAAKKVLRYLQGTNDHMLTYRKSYSLELIDYLDSDYDGCIDTRKSTFFNLFPLAGRAVSWKSTNQSVIATSTIEAKFVECVEATIHGVVVAEFHLVVKSDR